MRPGAAERGVEPQATREPSRRSTATPSPPLCGSCSSLRREIGRDARSDPVRCLIVAPQGNQACALGHLRAYLSRDLRDLAARTPSGVWRLGGHGLETLPPHARPGPSPPPPPEALLAPLRKAALLPGVRLELKGPVAALHYRAAPDAGPACLLAAETAARLAPGHVAQAGKMVVEVKPASAHKGTALRRLMILPPFAGRRPIMLGDGTTDEDALAEALALGGLAIKVGPGPSAARLRSPDPASVRAWIARLGLA